MRVAVLKKTFEEEKTKQIKIKIKNCSLTCDAVGGGAAVKAIIEIK